MSLSASLSTANSSLFVNGERTSLISRNMASADRAYYSRKSVEVELLSRGRCADLEGHRAEDQVMFRKITAMSATATYSAMVDSLATSTIRSTTSRWMSLRRLWSAR